MRSGSSWAACFILVATGGCETVGRTIFAAVDECREACLDLPPGKVSRCLEDCGDEDSPPDTTEVSP